MCFIGAEFFQVSLLELDRRDLVRAFERFDAREFRIERHLAIRVRVHVIRDDQSNGGNAGDELDLVALGLWKECHVILYQRTGTTSAVVLVTPGAGDSNFAVISNSVMSLPSLMTISERSNETLSMNGELSSWRM